MWFGLIALCTPSNGHMVDHLTELLVPQNFKCDAKVRIGHHHPVFCHRPDDPTHPMALVERG